MSKYFPLLFLLIYSLNLHGQIVSQTRVLDNNQGIAGDSTEWAIHRVIKNIDLSKHNESFNISFGGEIRQRARILNNINYGDVEEYENDRDIFWTQRYMLHSDIRLGNHFRVFGQMNSSHVVAKDYAAEGIDVDKLSVMQSFIDFATTGENKFLVRIGRQDISYGSGMMLGTRDGPNVRQTYDGVFTSLGFENLKADFFIVHPVNTQGSYFDNNFNDDFLVWSSYLTFRRGNNNSLEFYYFGAELKDAVFRTDTATDNRHSIGTRISHRGNSLNLSAEFTGQFGHFRDKTIRAFQALSEISYQWNEIPLRPRIGSRQVVISGDDRSEDNVIKLFRPVSARPPVNEMISAGSSNIMLLQPTLQLELFRNFSISGSYYAVWRQTVNDGIYAYDLNSNNWGNFEGEANDRFFTHGLYGSVDFQPNQHFHLSLVGCYFTAGEFLKASGKGEPLMASAIRLSYWF